MSFGRIILQLINIIALLYIVWRHRKYSLSIALALLAFARIFEFYGNTVQNIYKLAMLIVVTFVFIQRKAWREYKSTDAWYALAFIVFTIQFLFACFLYSSSTITVTFSQYARYFETFLLFFLVRQAIFTLDQREEMMQIFYDVFLFQVVYAVIKFILYPYPIEGLVGSFNVNGGDYGTIVPLIGAVYVWLSCNGKMTWKEWLFVLGLLLLGFTSAKRAVIFLLPVLVIFLVTYANGININKYLLLGILAFPILFYIGVRLTPTLNPDHKVGGRFDFDYAIDYAEHYQFGEEGVEGQIDVLREDDQVSYYAGNYRVGKRIEAEGRGGATVALIKLVFGPYKLSEQDLWGMGFKNMYGIDYDDFDKLPLTIHINHKGSATGLFQTYVSIGILGVFTTLIFCFAAFFYLKYNKLRYVLLVVAAWDYFMYSGFLFRNAFLMAAVFLFINIVNQNMGNAHVEQSVQQEDQLDKQILTT